MAEIATAKPVAAVVESPAPAALAMEATAAESPSAAAKAVKTAAAAKPRIRLRSGEQANRKQNDKGTLERQPETSAVHLRFSFISRNFTRTAFLGISASKSPAANFGSKFHCDNTAEYCGAIGMAT